MGYCVPANVVVKGQFTFDIKASCEYSLATGEVVGSVWGCCQFCVSSRNLQAHFRAIFSTVLIVYRTVTYWSKGG